MGVLPLKVDLLLEAGDALVDQRKLCCRDPPGLKPSLAVRFSFLSSRMPMGWPTSPYHGRLYRVAFANVESALASIARVDHACNESDHPLDLRHGAPGPRR